MAYDSQLAARIRAIVAGRAGVTEKVMFGGLAFLIDGKMFCGVLGEDLLARVGPAAHDAAMATPHVRIMDFTGRPMRGYVFVGPGAFQMDAELARWVEQCQAHAATLPRKGDKGSKRPKRSKPKKTRGSRARPSGGTQRSPRRRRKSGSRPLAR